MVTTKKKGKRPWSMQGASLGKKTAKETLEVYKNIKTVKSYCRFPI